MWFAAAAARLPAACQEGQAAVVLEAVRRLRGMGDAPGSAHQTSCVPAPSSAVGGLRNVDVDIVHQV